jgi:hypothetical protein
MLNWLHWHAQRAGWSAAEMARTTAGAGDAFSCIEFVAEAEACPICAGPVEVQNV